jgi:hypothetical protein
MIAMMSPDREEAGELLKPNPATAGRFDRIHLTLPVFIVRATKEGV